LHLIGEFCMKGQPLKRKVEENFAWGTRKDGKKKKKKTTSIGSGGEKKVGSQKVKYMNSLGRVEEKLLVESLGDEKKDVDADEKPGGQTFGKGGALGLRLNRKKVPGKTNGT